ncbi:ketopantoate reductase family protein [Streptomyces candidus]|uniref:2-dehydropantoate 2-reductase n=1 Tax=Streptomyces candidus TaxID=67283 RepID=A0A7X0LQT5_9ACTN|nr:2-dehydropantoate 2-reductase [Streptomyces candidus]MBB6437938.1 2-dehydropantoate 2-reductase [Streptomyces candidus]GHH49655.1 2-dehydropantoate 2-reductase [Streptomyces candidus]
MRILVVGAGATGGYFGARLALAGRDVTFLVRPRRAEVLRRRGLRITGLGTEEVLDPRWVTADRLDGTYDLVLLTVKATALGPALDDLAPAVGRDTVIVPVLNGLAHLDALAGRFGAGRVFGGVAKVLTTLNGEGDIVRLAPPATLTLGETGGGTTPRTDRIGALLGGVPGMETELSADVLGAMWAKWALIVTVSSVNLLGRGTVGEVVAVPGGVRLGPAVLAEAAAVADAAGHPLRAEHRAATAALVTEDGSPLTTSLYRDVVAGVHSEAEHLFGDLAARARTLGVSTPLLDLATLQLRVAESQVTPRQQVLSVPSAATGTSPGRTP